MTDALYSQTDQSGTSAINYLDPRTRLLTAVLTTVTLISIDSLVILTGALVFAAGITALAGLGAFSVVRRLVLLEGFVIVLLLVLPFTTTGKPLFELGPVAPSGEGLKLAAVIALKVNTITLLNLALIGTLSPLQVGNALRLLRVPGNLVQLLLMSVRYISVLENEYARIRRAMKARAFVARSSVHTWRTFGWLVGMLLVRSFERSRRVGNAMRCRGFNGSFTFHSESQWRILDGITLTLVTATSVCLIFRSYMT
jgi:cobalt/nickel transport system permease protein